MKVLKQKLKLRKVPGQERSKETVEIILKSTAQLLEKEGFENASTNKIAAKAGISIGSLYQYFPSKDAIVSRMMENYVDRQLKVIEQELVGRKNNDLKETIRTIILATVESKRKNLRFTKIFAQKFFAMAKVDVLKQMDAHLMAMFKKNMEPFYDELRMENIDLSLFIALQSVKVIPVTIMFSDDFDIADPKVVDELVHLTYQYLRK